MIEQKRKLFILIALVGWLTTILIIPGPSSQVSDTAARLEVSHWLWTGVSPKGPLPGVDGNHHYWYWLGQSLVMLPADIAITKVGDWILDLKLDTRHRLLAISYLIFPIVNAVALTGVFTLLTTLGTRLWVSAASTLILLFCSTLLWHFQNNQENPLQFALTCWAFVFVLKWCKAPQSFKNLSYSGISHTS